LCCHCEPEPRKNRYDNPLSNEESVNGDFDDVPPLPPPIQKLMDITIMCFNKHGAGRQKIGGSLRISLNVHNIFSVGDIKKAIEKETLPDEWGDINFDDIRYQLGKGNSADNFKIINERSVAQFLRDFTKKKDSTYLVLAQSEVPQTTKRRTLETDLTNEIKRFVYVYCYCIFEIRCFLLLYSSHINYILDQSK
jgi:hypothetical protein